jgi:hypothetical protein
MERQKNGGTFKTSAEFEIYFFVVASFKGAK